MADGVHLNRGCSFSVIRVPALLEDMSHALPITRSQRWRAAPFATVSKDPQWPQLPKFNWPWAPGDKEADDQRARFTADKEKQRLAVEKEKEKQRVALEKEREKQKLVAEKERAKAAVEKDKAKAEGVKEDKAKAVVKETTKAAAEQAKLRVDAEKGAAKAKAELEKAKEKAKAANEKAKADVEKGKAWVDTAKATAAKVVADKAKAAADKEHAKAVADKDKAKAALDKAASDKEHAKAAAQKGKAKAVTAAAKEKADVQAAKPPVALKLKPEAAKEPAAGAAAAGKHSGLEPAAEPAEEQAGAATAHSVEPQKLFTTEMAHPPPAAEPEPDLNEPVDARIARIVTYSDSEDEEEHLRVRAPPPDAESDSDDTDGEPLMERIRARLGRKPRGKPEALVVSSGESGIRRAGRAAGAWGSAAAAQYRADLSWGFLLKLALLWLLGRLRPRARRGLDVLCLAVPLAKAVADWQGLTGKLPSLGMEVEEACGAIKGLTSPACTLLALQLPAHIRKRRRRRSHAGEADVALLKGAAVVRVQGELRTAAQLAGSYPLEMAEMRRLLRLHGLTAPPPPFDAIDDAELFRFARACGLQEAGSSAQARGKAVEAAAERVEATVAWRQQEPFMGPRELATWKHILRWQGTDKEGRPVLVVRIARACQECSGNTALQFSRALISQTEHAMKNLLGNGDGQPELVVVLMDARGASTLHCVCHVGLFKSVCSTLNKHYPGRLAQLVVVEPPSILSWVIAAVKAAVSPMTASKVRVLRADDPALPISMHQLDALRTHISNVSQGDSPKSPNTPSRVKRIKSGGLTDLQARRRRPRTPSTLGTPGTPGTPITPGGSPGKVRRRRPVGAAPAGEERRSLLSRSSGTQGTPDPANNIAAAAAAQPVTRQQDVASRMILTVCLMLTVLAAIMQRYMSVVTG